jgi:GntR family transcriptional regulator/MocR family aminotransferase
MARWPHTWSLDPRADRPLFAQLAAAVAQDIRRGRLRPGELLPGTRTLAGTLGVHRNTVLAAYAELAAEGWVETATGRGTFVSADLPTAEAAPPGVPPGDSPGYEVAAGPEPDRPALARGVLVIPGGVPDLRLLPVAELARAYRRVVRSPRRAPLGYGDARGHSELREALAEMLGATRGVVASRDTVMVTRGSQMALYLAARALCRPGDRVAVEDPGYRPAWEAFSLAGAEVVPVAVDGDGLRVASLAPLLGIGKGPRVRAVYLTPHHQYPSTVTLQATRRLELLRLCREHRVAILEDDYDHEFHYEGRPVMPLAAADPTGQVVYVGTLSKVLAPGLRLGFLAASEPLVAAAAAHRSFIDVQGDLAVEAAVTDLLVAGDLQRHVRRARRVYRARRDLLASLLGERLGSALSFDVPSGGMALWARISPEIDALAWQTAALRHGVAFQTGSRFSFTGRPLPFLRLGFAALDDTELGDAVRRMAAALKEVAGPSRRS